MRKYNHSIRLLIVACILGSLLFSCTEYAHEDSEIQACIETAKRGLLDVPDDRSQRFLGKVQEDTALCRGGEKAVRYRDTPWVDWQNYYATGDAGSKQEGRDATTKIGKHVVPNGRGIDGALLDLEYSALN